MQHDYGSENSILQKSILPKLIYRFNAIQSKTFGWQVQTKTYVRMRVYKLTRDSKYKEKSKDPGTAKAILNNKVIRRT